nr:hypothetical protein [Pandoravirus massiliensis]
MWLRPTAPRRAPAIRTSAAGPMRSGPVGQPATRAVPMATRIAERSGSGDDDDDDHARAAHRATTGTVPVGARAAPSKIAHMIAPVDVAGGSAQSNARRRHPFVAPATASPARQPDNARGHAHAPEIGRATHGSNRARGTAHDARHVDLVAPKNRGTAGRESRARTGHSRRADVQGDVGAKAPLPSVTPNMATTGHAPRTKTHWRTGRSETKTAAPVDRRLNAHDIDEFYGDGDPTKEVGGVAKRGSSPLTLRSHDNDCASDMPDGINRNDTSITHTPDTTSDSDGNGDDEQEEETSTEWAATQVAALARARFDVAADQRRSAHRLADALVALRGIMEHAWSRGDLVSSSAVAEVEALARAFLRAGCCCTWEPAAAPLRASLGALVAQLAIDRPQEPTPCFVALLDALAAAVRLAAASEGDTERAPADPGQTVECIEPADPQRPNHCHTDESLPAPVARTADEHHSAVAHHERDGDAPAVVPAIRAESPPRGDAAQEESQSTPDTNEQGDGDDGNPISDCAEGAADDADK